MTESQHKLLHIVWKWHNQGMCVETSRTVRVAVMRELQQLGLVQKIRAVKCDGDGFALQPERLGPAWKFTDAGLAKATALFSNATPAEPGRIEA